jgi:hypothetical protein
VTFEKYIRQQGYTGESVRLHIEKCPSDFGIQNADNCEDGGIIDCVYCWAVARKQWERETTNENNKR